MKFKVGDRVSVRSDLVIDKSYGSNSINDEMINWCGKIVTIKVITSWNEYRIKEDGWNWTDEMFIGKVDPNDNCRGDPNG